MANFDYSTPRLNRSVPRVITYARGHVKPASPLILIALEYISLSQHSDEVMLKYGNAGVSLTLEFWALMPRWATRSCIRSLFGGVIEF